MKILQINKYHFKKGGSETYYFLLSQLLTQAGHEVIHFSMQHEQNLPSSTSNYFISNIDYKEKSILKRIKNGLNIFWNQEAYKKLDALLTQEKPDIAHIHNFSHQLSSSILFALKKHGIPVVMTTHDYKVISPNYTLFSENNVTYYGKKYWKYIELSKNMCKSILLVLEAYFTLVLGCYEKLIHQYIAPSKFMRDMLVKSGIQKNKVAHIYNPFDVKKVTPSSFDHGYLLYAGRLSSEKGVLTLLRACKMQKDIPVYIAGDGPLMNEVKAYVKQEKLEQVSVLGYKSGKELRDLYKYASAVIVPSEWYENNPYSIIEAFSYAKPVIGSHLGGIPELVLEGETGYVFRARRIQELAANMKAMMDNVKSREKMGQNARAFAQERFGLKKHLTQVLQIYADLIQSKKG